MPTKTATTNVTPQPKGTRPSRSRAAVAARAAASSTKTPAKAGKTAVAAKPKMTDVELVAIESEPTDVQASSDPVERLKLAKIECELLKAWEAKGAKAPRPATPNFDQIVAEANHRPGAKPRKARKGSKGESTTKRVPVSERTTQLTVNGKAPAPRHNRLSSVARATTMNGGTRMSAPELRSWLAERGIDELDPKGWSVTLPNGVVLASTPK